MAWLIPSIIATMTGTVILSFSYLYLFLQDRKNYLKIWAISWAIYFFRYVFMLLFLLGIKSPYFLIGNQISSLISSGLLLYGSYLLVDKKFPKIFIYFSVLDMFWICFSILNKFTFLIMSLPTFCFIGSIYIWTGYIFIKHYKYEKTESRIVGCTLIIWGLHKLNYPFLRPVAWFAPWGYLIATVLEFTTAIGFILIYFKKTRNELLYNQTRLLDAQRIAGIGDWSWRLEDNQLIWSDETYRIFGQSPENFNVTIDAFESAVHPDDYDLVISQKNAAVKESKKIDMEHRIVLPDKSIRWVHELSSVKRDKNDNIIMISGTVQNITKRKQSEEEFSKAQELARNILETSPNLIYIHDLQENVNIYAHPRMTTVLGYSPEDVRKQGDKLLSNILHPDDIPIVAAHHKRMVDIPDDQVVEVEYRMRHAQGYWRTFLSRDMVFARDDHGRGKQIIGSGEDITERKKYEEELLQQQKMISLNNKIANVFLTSSGNDIFTDTLDVILKSLESSFGYFGYIDREGCLNCPSMTRNIWEKCETPDKRIVFSKEIWGGLWRDSLNDKKTVISNNGLKLPEGHLQLTCAMAVPLVHHDKLIGQITVANREGGYHQYERYLLESAAAQTAPILSNLLDQEGREKEHKEMQARIEQAQKMEAIGNLAGGIAHDFNNILFPIIGMSELMLEDLPRDSIEYENAQEICRAGNRAKDLVNQILAFSRQSEQEMMPVKFQKVLKEVLKLCRSTIPTNIEIEQEIQQDCGSIWANSTQLHQIGMNLITNAYHAVQDKNGKIIVKLKEHTFEETDATAISVDPGKYAILSVSDNGVGISEEVKKKIFEPYSTTKEKGKGTGLGLSVVYGIVKNFGGDIQVFSALGSGTTFNIYLPIMLKKAGEPFNNSNIELQTGDEHILFVDDEPPITRLVQLMLTRLGYTVTNRLSSIEALEAFKENPDKFDMVISDMSMPHMTGDQLAHEIRLIRPEMPIILCTGFSDRISKELVEEIGVNGLLIKPIVKLELAETIRRIFDREPKQ